MSRAWHYLTEFHSKFDLDTDAPITLAPVVLTGKDLELRKNLINEEHAELIEALDHAASVAHLPEDHFTRKNAVTEVYKELADLVYVCYGLDVKIGSRLDAVLEEVHKSNMSKVNEDGTVTRREGDGKVIKPANYQAPDLRDALGDNRPTLTNEGQYPKIPDDAEWA
jgi:predicted HAD superfamily Cof-like phosphohydrolase